MAPEAKAARVLPTLFPRAAKPLPSITHEQLQQLINPADVEAFEKELDRTVLHAPLRRGAGWGGSIAEFWRWAPRYASDWLPIRRFLTQLAFAVDIAEDTYRAYSSSRILATDRTEPDKVRPLGLGVFFRRCVNGAKAKVFQNRVGRATEPFQYAAGRTKTAETMHKTALLDLDTRLNAGIHKFDVSNAHHEYERVDAFQSVASLVPEMLPWVAGELCMPTNHYYVGPSGHTLELTKDRGGDQGDPSTSMIFMLTYHGVIAKTQAAARSQDPRANAYAYQDDLDMIAEPRARSIASQTYSEECAKVGLSANRAKETWTPGRGVDCHAIPQGVRITDRATVLKHGGGGAFEVPVTVPTGRSPGSQLANDSPELQRLQEDRRRLFSRLQELRAGGLPKVLALSLLRFRTCGDATFLARACGIPQQVAKQLDDELAAQIIEISGQQTWDPTARKRIFHPWADSGMGFTSVSSISAGAAAASWQANVGQICSRLQYDSVARLRTDSAWFRTVQQECAPALHILTGHRSSYIGDTSLADFKQSAVTKSIVAAGAEELLSKADLTERSKSAIRSAGGRGAGSWMCPPCEPMHHFTDRQLEITMCTRMDLDIPGHSGSCQHKKRDGTICGDPLDPKGKHARACRVQGWRVRRHNAVTAGLAEWCASHGCSVEEEVVMPTASDFTDESRLDLIVRTPNHPHPLHVDVTLADATSVEALSKNAASRDGAAAQVLEYRKSKNTRISR